MSESVSPTVEFTSVAKEFRHEYVVEKSLYYNLFMKAMYR